MVDEAGSDEDLMEAFRDGSLSAFEMLYRRHRGGVYRYFLRQCSHAEDAQEMLQDVWTRLVAARARYTPSAKFTTYLYQLAHNRLVDHYRRQHTAGAVQVDLSAPDDDAPAAWESMPGRRSDQPEERWQLARYTERLFQTLAALPAEQREVFLLREEGGLTVEEIAVATGANLEATKSRLRYALRKLRQALSDVEEGL